MYLLNSQLINMSDDEECSELSNIKSKLYI